MEQKLPIGVNDAKTVRKFSVSSTGDLELTSKTRQCKELQCQQNNKFLMRSGRSLDSMRTEENNKHTLLRIDIADIHCGKNEPAEGLIVAKTRKRRLVRKHVVGVVRDLSNVLYEINSVTSELRGVLNQIERVTSHIELSARAKAMNVSENDVSSLKSPTLETYDLPPRSASCYALVSCLTDMEQTRNPSIDQKEPPLASMNVPQIIDSNTKCCCGRKTQRCTISLTEGARGQCRHNYTPAKSIDGEWISDSNSSTKCCVGLHCNQRHLDRPNDLNCSYQSFRSRPNTFRKRISPVQNVSEIFNATTCRNTTPYEPKNTRCINQRSDELNSISIEDLFQMSKTLEQKELEISQKDEDLSTKNSTQKNSSLGRALCSRSKSVPVSLSKEARQSKNDEMLSDFRANYDRGINTWTTFAMVHIDGDEQDQDPVSM